jgi:hypothetical protein
MESSTYISLYYVVIDTIPRDYKTKNYSLVTSLKTTPRDYKTKTHLHVTLKSPPRDCKQRVAIMLRYSINHFIAC